MCTYTVLFFIASRADHQYQSLRKNSVMMCWNAVATQQRQTWNGFLFSNNIVSQFLVCIRSWQKLKSNRIPRNRCYLSHIVAEEFDRWNCLICWIECLIKLKQETILNSYISTAFEVCSTNNTAAFYSHDSQLNFHWRAKTISKRVKIYVEFTRTLYDRCTKTRS